MRELFNVVAVLALMAVAFAVGRMTTDAGLTYADTTRVTMVDTVLVRKPVPVDSSVLRYTYINVPIGVEVYDTIDVVNVRDSVAVRLPISQKHYTDSLYEAWVSGYQPSLDSITVYNRTHVITIDRHAKPHRWHIGASAGAAITPSGVQPYVGVGITYSIRSF